MTHVTGVPLIDVTRAGRMDMDFPSHASSRVAGSYDD